METTVIRKKRRESGSDRIFYAVNLAILLLLAAIVVYPLYFIVIASISNADAVLGGRVFLYPVDITLVGYSKIVERTDVWRGYLNTIIYTFLSTLLSLFVTILAGWALSRKTLPFRKFFMVFFIITMFFGGGLIPTFLWYRTLGFIDNRLVYILPGMVGVYNLVMIRNFISTSPGEMEESARLDGANDFQIYLHIILPMSKPILATVGLWLIVGNWNAWFDCLVYMRSGSKQVLQVVLRRILNEGSNEMLEGANVEDMAVSPEMLKAATIFVSTIPVLLIYPFLQKYFVKGIYVGSLKG